MTAPEAEPSPGAGGTVAAVTDIIDSRMPAPSVRPVGRPKVDTSQLSQTPEAIRKRQERERRRATVAPSTSDAIGVGDRSSLSADSTSLSDRATPDVRPDGQKFTPADFRHDVRELHGPPIAIVPSPDEIRTAVRMIARGICAAGLIVATVTKDERMKVPEPEANNTAELVVQGWPELALGMHGDEAAKLLAILAGGSLIVERVGYYRERRVLESGGAAEVPVDDPMRARVETL